MLMLRLFRTFASTYVHLKEVPAEFLETIETDADFVAGKRDAGAWKHFHSMNKDMFVVYMVRHPYDVLTSYHPKSKDAQQFYISPDRWMNEYGALRQLEARHPDEARIIYVRYEDLVSQPDVEQCRIADLTGQQIAVPFSKHQNISGGSVEKFRKREDFVRYIRGLSPDVRTQINAF